LVRQGETSKLTGPASRSPFALTIEIGAEPTRSRIACGKAAVIKVLRAEVSRMSRPILIRAVSGTDLDVLIHITELPSG
jgi:hypothetical protein